MTDGPFDRASSVVVLVTWIMAGRAGSLEAADQWGTEQFQKPGR